MQRLDPTSRGIDRFRIGAWRGDGDIALLSPKPGSTPTTDGIGRALEEVRRRGFRSVLTPALAAGERTAFEAAGFELHERLHLLSHDLRELPPAPEVDARLRRGRRRDIDDALRVDGLAFEPFWRFSTDGLAEARLATPRSRFRVVEHRRRLLGYHVTGCSDRAGYLQRLAVHPESSGRGLGSALVIDALRWSLRRGCTTVFVNTQETNTRALALYERLGFVLEPSGLAVLERNLDPDPNA